MIINGHHAVRAAAEEGRVIDVLISALVVPAYGDSILDLPLEQKIMAKPREISEIVTEILTTLMLSQMATVLQWRG